MLFLLITTGGTIGAMPVDDPQHPPDYSTLPQAGVNTASDYIRTLIDQQVEDLTVIELEPRDSKDIDIAYRRRMETAIAQSPHTQVLITHGTDAILASAETLHGKFPDKTIILTGAMTPLLNGPDVSDGFRNLRLAVDLLLGTALPNGVHIVLSDYAEGPDSEWVPKHYAYSPGAWQKFYDPEDGARSRLVAVDMHNL